MSVLNVLANSIQDTLAFYKRRRQFDDLFKYIRKKAPTESATRNVRELNGQLDAIITDFVVQLRAKQLESLPIARLHEQFTQKWMGLTFKGAFTAENGKISNLSTLYRREKCVLSVPRENARILTITLGMKTALVEFDRYELHCGLINTTGKISIEARDNAVIVRIAMELKKNCKMQKLEVVRAEVSKCGNFKIHITGFGNLGGNSVAKAIVKMMLNKHINDMKRDFENELKMYMQKTIDSFTT